MAELMAFVGLMVATGYALRRLELVRAEAAKDLSQIVFNFTLPPLIFQALRQAELSWSLLVLPAIAWAIALVGVAVGLPLTRLFKLPRERAGALVMAVVFGNTTFFGYPVLEGFYGPRGLTLAVFFDLLGATMATNTVAVALASATGGGRRVESGEMLRKLLVFPPIWALVLGLALHSVRLPAPVETMLGRIGGLTTPLIMLSIGLSLQFRSWRASAKLVGIAAVGKLVLVPAIVLLAVNLAGLPLDFKQAAVMQAAMPTMFFSLTLALLFALPVDLMVNAIMTTTLLSFATLPVWHAILAP
jgi:auxin efflux carrier (AEC)